MRIALLALPLILAGCLDTDPRHQTSNAGADGQPATVQARTQSPTDAVELVRGKNAVGHRDFVGAKKVLPRVFAGIEEDSYCGCKYTGKEIDLTSCGYLPRKNETRAKKLEWEHVVPAWTLGHQRPSWQDGGRKNCTTTDPVFQQAEGDLNNLVPAVGEVNGDRGNLSYGTWTRSLEPMYGQCTTIVDFTNKRVQPREEVRGRAARISLYMHTTYGLNISKQDKQLWCAWAKTYPVDEWERARDSRIIKLQGEGNPLVSTPEALTRLCG